MFYTKQKLRTVFYRNYQTFNKKKLRMKLESELRKFETNNIEFQTFDNTFLFVLNANAPLQQKHLSANNAGFITKDMGKLL